MKNHTEIKSSHSFTYEQVYSDESNTSERKEHRLTSDPFVHQRESDFLADLSHAPLITLKVTDGFEWPAAAARSPDHSVFVPGWSSHWTSECRLHHYQFIRVVPRLIVEQQLLYGSLFNLQEQKKTK